MCKLCIYIGLLVIHLQGKRYDWPKKTFFRHDNCTWSVRFACGREIVGHSGSKVFGNPLVYRLGFFGLLLALQFQKWLLGKIFQSKEVVVAKMNVELGGWINSIIRKSSTNWGSKIFLGKTDVKLDKEMLLILERQQRLYFDW